MTLEPEPFNRGEIKFKIQTFRGHYDSPTRVGVEHIFKTGNFFLEVWLDVKYHNLDFSLIYSCFILIEILKL